MIRKFLILLISAIPTSLLAQVDSIYYDRTYGGDSRDWNGQMLVTPAGDIFFIGDVQSDTTGNKSVPLCSTAQTNSDIWISKINSDGNIIWQKDLGADGDERLPQMISVSGSTGNLLMVCQSASNIACDKTEPNRDTVPAYSTDYWVSLLDNNGNIIWEKTIGGESFDDYVQVAELTGGEFLIAGESNSPVSGEKTIPNYSAANDLWTVKLNSSGAIMGDNVYGGDGAEYLTSVLALDQNQYLLSGSTTSDISGDVSETTRGSFDYWMIKIDAGGSKVWDKRFGGSGGERCQSTINTNDGGFLMCGYTTSPADGDVSQNPKGLQDIWLVKTDASGNKEWDKRYGGNSACIPSKVMQTQDNGFLIFGYTDCLPVGDVSDPGYGNTDYWLLKIDSSGAKLWDKRFGGTGDDFATSWGAVSDSSLLLFGYADSGSTVIRTDTAYGEKDLWLVKADLQGITTGISEIVPPASAQFQISPNPSTGIVTITPDQKFGEVATLRVFDNLGKVVIHISKPACNPEGNFNLDLNEFGDGTFTVILLNDKGHTASSRLVVTH